MRLTPVNQTDFNLLLETIANQPLIYAYYGRDNKHILTDENIVTKIQVAHINDDSYSILFYHSKYLNRALQGYLEYDVSDGTFNPSLTLHCHILGDRNIQFEEWLQYEDAFADLVCVAGIVCRSLGVNFSCDRQLQ